MNTFSKTSKTTHIIFDWGDTLMRDFPEKQGPMASWDVIELIEGVETILDTLKEHFCLAVATNAGESDTALMKVALHRGGIENMFTHFFSSKDLGYAKPHIMFFTLLCKNMKVLPENCIFIGNDYKKDIEGAAAAGMKTVFFNHAKQNGNFEKANHIIFNLSQLHDCL
jgi:HAD superfamily hydrolase (TIGR01509 family)